MSNLCNCAKCAQKKYLSASNDECFSEEGDKTEKNMETWVLGQQYMQKLYLGITVVSKENS